MSNPFTVRDYKPEDKNFIMATFLRGLYYGDSWYSYIPKDIFMDNYKRIGEAMLTHPNYVVKIACLPEDEDVILGYSILSADYLDIHYCFVKTAWRRQGIAKGLVPNYPRYITHLTALGKTLMYKLEGAKFNPFAV